MENLDKKLVIMFERTDDTCLSVTIKGDRNIMWADSVKKEMPGIIKSLEETDNKEMESTREACLRSLSEIAEKPYKEITKELEAMDGGICPKNITILSIKYIGEYLNKQNHSDKKKKAKK